jgi:hypothetical protein
MVWVFDKVRVGWDRDRDRSRIHHGPGTPGA